LQQFFQDGGSVAAGFNILAAKSTAADTDSLKLAGSSSLTVRLAVPVERCAAGWAAKSYFLLL
jgi:hypothetical protein